MLLHIVQFFNNALVVGKSSESELGDHLYELIYELHSIDSSVLLAVLPQLESKLTVSMDTCTCVSVLMSRTVINVYTYILIV